MSNNLLLDEEPLVLQRSLAVALGLNEAIIVQQIHYWLCTNKKKNHNFVRGHYWSYNTLEAWHEEFPWWSLKTIQRTLTTLINQGILVARALNSDVRDRTLWYSINYPVLNKVLAGEKPSDDDLNFFCEEDYCPTANGQNDQMQGDKMTTCTKTKSPRAAGQNDQMFESENSSEKSAKNSKQRLSSSDRKERKDSVCDSQSASPLSDADNADNADNAGKKEAITIKDIAEDMNALCREYDWRLVFDAYRRMVAVQKERGVGNPAGYVRTILKRMGAEEEEQIINENDTKEQMHISNIGDRERARRWAALSEQEQAQRLAVAMEMPHSYGEERYGLIIAQEKLAWEQELPALRRAPWAYRA